MTAAEVHEFWFGPLADGFAAAGRRRDWFSGDPALDRQIVERFGHLIEQAAGGGLDDWLATPRGVLSFILVCDQFSRQMHRGTPAAFATDALAVAVAQRGIEAGTDRALGFDERAFFYLPFEHSERLIDQHTAVGLFALLRDETPEPHRAITTNYLRYAEQHRDIILEFGRFPHRNAVLGRGSTPAEQAFLKTGPSFGQGAVPEDTTGP